MNIDGYYVGYPEDVQRPPLAILRFITPDGFGPQHLQQLRRLEDFAWDGTSAKELALRVYHGDAWLWEVGDDEEKAVVVTSLIVTRGRRSLWIDGAAGNGILARAPLIVGDLKAIAKFYNCDAIRAASEREGFESLPDKLGFACVSTIWELETDHERRYDTLSDHAERDADDSTLERGAATIAGSVRTGGDGTEPG